MDTPSPLSVYCIPMKFCALGLQLNLNIDKVVLSNGCKNYKARDN